MIKIIGINIILSGGSALVIALAVVATALLQMSFLQFGGGLLLLWIGALLSSDKAALKGLRTANHRLQLRPLA